MICAKCATNCNAEKHYVHAFVIYMSVALENGRPTPMLEKCNVSERALMSIAKDEQRPLPGAKLVCVNTVTMDIYK